VVRYQRKDLKKIGLSVIDRNDAGGLLLVDSDAKITAKHCPLWKT